MCTLRVAGHLCISILINILGSCFWSYATKAFLFSFNNVKGYNPVKLTQYRNHFYPWVKRGITKVEPGQRCSATENARATSMKYTCDANEMQVRR